MDKSQLTGKDFEFLITPNDFEINANDFDNIMTPSSIPWKKIIRNNWAYYQVGNDEFSYSWEPPGIQMTFNGEMPYDKAKAIGDEVVAKLSKYINQEISLIFISHDHIIKFE